MEERKSRAEGLGVTGCNFGRMIAESLSKECMGTKTRMKHIWTFLTKEFIQYMVFSDRLTSLSIFLNFYFILLFSHYHLNPHILFHLHPPTPPPSVSMFSRFIHIVAHSSTSFLSLWLNNISLYGYSTLVYPFISE